MVARDGSALSAIFNIHIVRFQWAQSSHGRIQSASDAVALNSMYKRTRVLESQIQQSSLVTSQHMVDGSRIALGTAFCRASQKLLLFDPFYRSVRFASAEPMSRVVPLG